MARGLAMSGDPRGYYARLGLTPTASDVEIKLAYRHLVHAAYPDGRAVSVANDNLLKQIDEAYSVLGDPQKKLEYDEQSRRPSRGVSPQPTADRLHGIGILVGDVSYRPTADKNSTRRSRLFKSGLISAGLGFALLACAAIFFSFFHTKNLVPGTTFSDCYVCPPMIVIPPGSFSMGLSSNDDTLGGTTRPSHLVSIPRAIAVSRFVITNDQYAAFLSEKMKGPGYDKTWVQTDQETRDSHLLWRVRLILPESGYESHPVTLISWQGAQAYVRWLSSTTGQHYRLLSEAEWEYAARAGTQTRFYFGDDLASICEYGNVPDITRRQHHPNWAAVACTDGFSEAAPVGSFKPNAFGLYDMIGNVWEWVEDCWHDRYDGAPISGGAWLSGGDCNARVIRGQSYDFLNPQAGIATRMQWATGGELPTIGFRVGRDIVP
jgi:sulfatase modifying factor 1